MKKFTRFAALLFGFGAIVHVYRLYSHFTVYIGNYKMPVMLSWFFVFAGCGIKRECALSVIHLCFFTR